MSRDFLPYRKLSVCWYCMYLLLSGNLSWGFTLLSSLYGEVQLIPFSFRGETLPGTFSKKVSMAPTNNSEASTWQKIPIIRVLRKMFARMLRLTALLHCSEKANYEKMQAKAYPGLSLSSGKLSSFVVWLVLLLSGSKVFSKLCRNSLPVKKFIKSNAERDKEER